MLFDEEISDDEKSDSDVAMVAAPTALQRVTSFNLRPSLEDLHYPGWTIEIVAGQVMMKEVEKDRVYFVPVSRFNKAAELLLQENVIRGLEASIRSKTHCRCNRGCASGVTVDSILASRLWFFEHATHELATVELAKVMANNLSSKLSMYVLSSETKVPCKMIPSPQVCPRFYAFAHGCSELRTWTLQADGS